MAYLCACLNIVTRALVMRYKRLFAGTSVVRDKRARMYRDNDAITLPCSFFLASVSAILTYGSDLLRPITYHLSAARATNDGIFLYIHG